MSRVPILALALTLLLCASTAAGEETWTVRGAAVYVSPTGDDLLAVLPTGDSFRFAVDDGVGFAVELEYEIRPRLGVEIAALATDLDAELRLEAGGAALRDTESSAFELFSLGVNYDLTPERAVHVRIGAFAAITYFDDVVFLTEIGRAEKLVFDDDIGFGLKLGVDRAFGSGDRWVASLAVRYLRAILEGEVAGQDADLDPLIVTFGVGYRF